jgi:hypothetical protein
MIINVCKLPSQILRQMIINVCQLHYNIFDNIERKDNKWLILKIKKILTNSLRTPIKEPKNLISSS